MTTPKVKLHLSLKSISILFQTAGGWEQHGIQCMKILH